MHEIGRMTWRRFLVLLRGLSGESVTATVARVSKGSGRSETPIITEPDEVDATFRRIFGSKRRR